MIRNGGRGEEDMGNKKKVEKKRENKGNARRKEEERQSCEQEQTFK